MRLLIKIYLRQQIISVIRPEDMRLLVSNMKNQDYEPLRRLGIIKSIFRSYLTNKLFRQENSGFSDFWHMGQRMGMDRDEEEHPLESA